MRFEVLGALRVTREGAPVDLGGPKEQVVLARLLAANGGVVPVPSLIASVWGEDAPRSAVKTLQTYVLRLRRGLEPDRASGEPARLLVRTSGGYRLDVPADEVDARHFENLVVTARDALADRPDEAAALLEEALNLWRGPAYAGFEDADFAAAEVSRLEELRLNALEDLQDARLASGRVVEAVADLRRLTQGHPLRERLWCQLMTALYRCGRQAEALEAYDAVRRQLAEELGVEPGPALRSLHAAVLAQEPALIPGGRRPLPPELRAAGPLVGRDRELEWLRRAWREALTGGPRSLALIGPPGSGRTRLAAELAREVSEAGADVEYAVGPPPPGRRARRTLIVIRGEGSGPFPQGPVLTVLLSDVAPVGMPARVLEPLSRPCAVQLAASVLGRDDVEDAVAVVDQVGTLPGRVVARARERAREVAGARVASVASETRRHSAELARTRSALVASVAQLEALTANSREDVDGCPYPGLAAFDVADASNFFGRERLVAELVARLATTGFLALVGPSGSGKSSAARAGLLAALARDALPGSARWPQLVIRPGERPLGELAGVLPFDADARPDHVFLIDQFEETFTACVDDAERKTFIDLLLNAAAAGAHVVLALRADFYGHCAAYPRLAAALADGSVLVPPMLEPEMRRAIERPATDAGLRLDEGLADALVADVGDRVGGLPLLAATLRDLWEARTGGRLTLRSYVAVGGISGAVARLAENAYAALPEQQRDTARRLLLRLTGPGDGDLVVRRRVALTELAGLPDPDIGSVLQAFIARRLLTAGDGYVEFAHETVLREWPRLRSWLDDDRQGRALHRRLVTDAARWDAEGRLPEGLYRGARLAAAVDWVNAHPAEVTETEDAFVAAGRAELARAEERARQDAAAARRTSRLLRRLLTAATLLTVAAVLAGAVAVNERARSQRETEVAQSRSLAAAALIEPSLDRALLLAAAAVRRDNTPETRGALLSALARAPAARSALRTQYRLFSLDTSRDGRVIAAGAGSPGAVHIWAGVRKEHRVVRVKPVGTAWETRLSPDARTVAIWLAISAVPLDVVVYDVASGAELWRLHLPGFDASNATPADNGGLAYSPDGALLAANVGTGVAIIDVRRHRVARILPQPSTNRGIAFAPDGTLLITARFGHALAEWDARRGVRLRKLPVRGPIATATNAPVVLGFDAHGAPTALNLRTGKRVVGLGTQLIPLAVSADGRRAAATTEDGRIEVFDVATMRRTDELVGHTGAVTAARFLPDGTLISSSQDGSVMQWERDPRHRLEYQTTTAPFPLQEVTIGADGATALGVDARGRLWLLSDTRRVRVPGVGYLPFNDYALAGAFPGTSIAVPGSSDPAAEPAELFAGGRVVRLLSTGRRWVDAVAMSPSGSRLAIINKGQLIVTDRQTGNPVGPPAAAPTCDGCPIALRSDGRRVALALGSQLRVVDIATAREQVVAAPAPVTAIAWTGATEIAYGTLDGRVGIWQIRNPAPKSMTGRHAGRVYSVAASPAGGMVASGGEDGSVRLWDARSGDALGSPLPGPDAARAWAAFRPDGQLFAVYGDGSARTWRLDPSTWLARACAVAGRKLTHAEWSSVVGSAASFTPACS